MHIYPPSSPGWHLFSVFFSFLRWPLTTVFCLGFFIFQIRPDPPLCISSIFPGLTTSFYSFPSRGWLFSIFCFLSLFSVSLFFSFQIRPGPPLCISSIFPGVTTVFSRPWPQVAPTASRMWYIQCHNSRYNGINIQYQIWPDMHNIHNIRPDIYNIYNTITQDTMEYLKIWWNKHTVIWPDIQ